jgi:hypothetical protein
MNKTSQVFIGIGTFIQILMMLSYGAVFYYDFELAKAFTLIYIAFINTWTLCLQIIFIIHLLKNQTIKTKKKTRWIILFLLLSPFSMPSYWYKYIWKPMPNENT